MCSRTFVCNVYRALPLAAPRAGEHGEDGRVRVVKGHGIHRAELGQVVAAQIECYSKFRQQFII